MLAAWHPTTTGPSSSSGRAPGRSLRRWPSLRPETSSTPSLLGWLPSTEQSVAGGTTVTGPAHEARAPGGHVIANTPGLGYSASSSPQYRLVLQQGPTRARVESPARVALSRVWGRVAYALSAKGGHVAINASVDAPLQRFHLAWRESGGPPVAAPRRRGFQGQASVAFEASAVACTIAIPLG